MVREKMLRGSTVVEMAYLMPVVLLAWMLILYALFYYHDKNVLGGAAYETAVVGSELLHGQEELPEGELTAYFQRRIRGKLLFFRGAAVQVEKGEGEIAVQAWAMARWMAVSVERKAAVTRPEEHIRKVRAGKQLIEDVKS